MALIHSASVARTFFALGLFVVTTLLSEESSGQIRPLSPGVNVFPGQITTHKSCSDCIALIGGLSDFHVTVPDGHKITSILAEVDKVDMTFGQLPPLMTVGWVLDDLDNDTPDAARTPEGFTNLPAIDTSVSSTFLGDFPLSSYSYVVRPNFGPTGSHEGFSRWNGAANYKLTFVVSVPEPASAVLGMAGMFAVVALMRRRG